MDKNIFHFEFVNSVLADDFREFCVILESNVSSQIGFEANFSEKEKIGEIRTQENFCEVLVLAIDRMIKKISGAHSELSDSTLMDLKFLFVAWADEVLIKVGKKKLSIDVRDSLESRLFGTENAGDEFFNKVDKMLLRRSVDDICLGAAYWLALVLGFEGRYIGGSNEKELKKYTNGLKNIVFHQKLPVVKQSKFLKRDEVSHDKFQSNFDVPIKPWVLVTLAILTLIGWSIIIDFHWRDRTAALMTRLHPLSELNQSKASYGGVK